MQARRNHRTMRGATNRPTQREFVDSPRIAGAIVHDARIAAVCVVHGVEALLTRDRDFSMFPQLPTQDPLTRAL